MPFIIWLVWNLILLSRLAQSAEGQPSIPPKKITWDIDNAPMVLISPGHFQMGWSFSSLSCPVIFKLHQLTIYGYISSYQLQKRFENGYIWRITAI